MKPIRHVAPAQFVAIMASFPSGVAVVTARDEDGVPRGLTTNSCCSGSLDPPLVLVSVSKTSATLPAITARQCFAVNYLAAGSERVCERFASKAEDKYEGMSYELSALGNPVLSDAVCAYADCRVVSMVETGDHWLIVGAVDDGEVRDERPPLVYHRRAYFRLSPADGEPASVGA